MALILTAGDIAIVGKRGAGSDPGTSGNPNNDDSFAFVALVDIDAGAVISFTDKEWAAQAGGLTTGEGVFTYTAGAAIAAGTVITIRFDGNTGVFPGGMSLPSVAGDQIIAFQGTIAAPTILDVFQDRGPFQATGTGVNDSFNNNTEIPPGIVEGQTAVALGAAGSDVTNWAYVGPTSGSKADLQAAIHNPNNWTGSTTFSAVTFPSSFNIGAPATPAEINVRGNGIDIVDGDVTPSYADNTIFGGTAVTGGLVDRTFTISNQGGTTLNVGAISVTGANASDFSVIANPTSTVAAGGSTTFTVRFNPSSGGLKNAAISIANGDSDENPYNFNVSGSGVTASPTPLAAGDIAFVGFNGDFTTTTFGFVVLKDIVAGTVIKFTDGGWTGAGLASTESAVEWVAPSDITFGTVISFNEANLGPNFQTTSDGGYFTGTRFHLESSGDQIFAYTGSASSPTFLGGIHTDSSSFDGTYGGGPGSSLVPPGLTDGVTAISFGNGATNFFSGVYSGSTTGDQAALLAKINNEVNWTGSASPQTLPTAPFGGGSAAPEIDVQFQVGGVAIADGDTTPVQTDGTQFAAQDVAGGSQSHTFVIRNLGDQTLNLGQVTVTGANASDFTFTLGSPTVGASLQTTLTVTFNPSAAGARTATITIPSNDGNEASYDFAVSGTGRDPGQALSAGDIAFAGYDSNQNQFAFVLLADIAAGTSIKFTNGGWTGSTYRQGDGAVEWVAPADLVAGSVVVYDETLPNGGPDWAAADTGYFTGSFNPQIAGDQIIAYQGTASAGGAGLVNLAALYYDKSDFDSVFADSIGSSLLPAGLVDGQTAISFGKPDGVSAYETGVYTGPTNLPFPQQLLALNNAANWTGSDLDQSFPAGPIGVVPNGVPSAVDDTFAVAQRTTTASAAPVLGNDSDPESATLSVTAIAFGATSAGVTPGVDAVISGAYGTLTIRTDGSYSYAADVEGGLAVDAVAVDDFVYTVSDPLGASVQANLAVSITGSGLGDGNANVFVLTGGDKSATGLGGNDVYVVDSAGDQAIEAGADGTDEVRASISFDLGANLETLTFSAGAGNLAGAGNGDANTLTGNEGDNILNGKGASDTMIGGDGNDTFFVDHIDDRIVELFGGGTDRVVASTNYSLGSSIRVERMEAFKTGSTAALNLTGNEIGQTLLGNNGDNVLNGKGGVDVMRGYGGNDTYFVDQALDKVVEEAAGGFDRVIGSVSYALEAAQEIERIEATTTGSTLALDFTGNEFTQLLVGNNGANVLNGRGGSDVLIGNGGQDAFVFDTLPDAGNIDRIGDFAVASDRICLDSTVFTQVGADGALSASALAIGSTGIADQAEQRIIYDTASGALSYDADGSGNGATAVQFATLQVGLALTAADFLIV